MLIVSSAGRLSFFLQFSANKSAEKFGRWFILAPAKRVCIFYPWIYRSFQSLLFTSSVFSFFVYALRKLFQPRNLVSCSSCAHMMIKKKTYEGGLLSRGCTSCVGLTQVGQRPSILDHTQTQGHETLYGSRLLTGTDPLCITNNLFTPNHIFMSKSRQSDRFRDDIIGFWLNIQIAYFPADFIEGRIGLKSLDI